VARLTPSVDAIVETGSPLLCIRLASSALDFPGMPHSMHGHQPELYTRTVTEWAAKLPDTTTR